MFEPITELKEIFLKKKFYSDSTRYCGRILCFTQNSVHGCLLRNRFCFLFRRVDALKDELHRLESMTHLTKEEKEFLIKEKQDILFKSVNFYLNFK